MTSWAKSTPAIGALNEAETALATPQASRMRRAASGRRKVWQSAVPMVAPRCTTGPSRPALAPQPRETEVRNAEEMPGQNGRPRPPWARASITSGTPPARCLGWIACR